MTFMSASDYFSQRAASARASRDAATEACLAFAHDQVATRYQEASDAARATEQRRDDEGCDSAWESEGGRSTPAAT